MHRLAVTALLGIGLAAFSGQLLPDDAPAPQSATAVSAPPPALVMGDGQVPSDSSDDARNKALAHLQSQHTGLSQREVYELSATVVEEAARHDLDPELVLAVMQVESNCYHMAVSPVGALGLMQLLPSTGEELARHYNIEWRGPETLFDPFVNVKLGVAYLGRLSDRYRSMPTALAAYNWGPGRIDRRLRRGARVPSLYAKQVMRAYESVSPPPSESSS
jgi:soluble lytic murein transglycosylase-like protein